MKNEDYKNFDELFNFNTFFNQQCCSTEQCCESYDINQEENGDNIISISAMGHSIDNIEMSVKEDKLKIETVTDTELPLASSIDLEFELKGIFDPEKIKAKLLNGILTITVSPIIKKEKEAKKIIITS